MRLVLKSRSMLWFPFLIALMILLIATASIAGVVLSMQATSEEALVPFLAMACMGLTFFGLIGIPLLLVIQFERRAILRLLDNYWVCWEQFDTDAEWHKFADGEHQQKLEANRLPWVMFVILIVIFSGVTGYVVFMMQSIQGNTTPYLAIAIPLGMMFSIVLVLTMGRPILEQRNSRAKLRNRLQSPIPKVYIGKQGMYNEDTGYRTFRSLNENLINARRLHEGKPILQFEFRIHSRYTTYTHYENIIIPPKKHAEADALLSRFIQEQVIRR